MIRLLLVYGVAVLGFLVPILPRLIAPMVAPRPRYYDTLDTWFGYDPLWGVGMCIWTALPFLVLSTGARSLLKNLNVESPLYYQRTVGVIFAFISAFIIGLIIHFPQTSAGVNFGILFFPAYTVVIMPSGYVLGVAIVRLIRRTSGFFIVQGVFLFHIALLCQTNQVCATSMLELPGMKWERHFGDDKYVYNAQAIAISGEDRNILIAGTSALAEESGKADNFWLWTVNPNGEKIKEVQINSPHQDGRIRPAYYTHIKSLKVLDHGEVLLVIEFLEGQPSIVKIDKHGRILLMKSIGKLEGHHVFEGMVRTTDKRILLFGRSGANAFIVKLDPAGNIIWEKTVVRDEPSSFMEGFPTNDGGAVLIGNSGAYDQFIGSSNLWVVKINVKGNIESERTFVGRHGSIARSHDGGYVIVYDNNDFKKTEQNTGTQQVLAQKLTFDLKPLWETLLLTIERGLGRFDIASVPSGDFVIVGSKRNQFWVSRINESGKETWSFFDAMNIKRMSAQYHVVSSDNEFLVLYSGYSENKKGKLNTKVGLIKFIQK